MADYDLQYQDTHIDALLATANELKTAGYIYKGVATPSTNPGTPTERVAYLASEPGTYTNFGGIVITSGLYSLTYAGGTWTGTQMQAGSDIEVVQTTGQSASDVMSQKAVTDNFVTKNDYIYKKSGGFKKIINVFGGFGNFGNAFNASNYRLKQPMYKLINTEQSIHIRAFISYADVSTNAYIDRVTISLFDKNRVYLNALDLGWFYFNNADVEINIDLQQSTYKDVCYCGLFFGSNNKTIRSVNLNNTYVELTYSDDYIGDGVEDLCVVADNYNQKFNLTEILQTPYYTSYFSGGTYTRGLLIIDLNFVKDFTLDITLNANPVVKMGVQGWRELLTSSHIYDSKYLTGNTTITKNDVGNCRYLALVFTYISNNSGIPTIAQILTDFSATFTYTHNGIVNRLDALEKNNVDTPFSWLQQLETTTYFGEKIDLSENSYTYERFSTLLPLENPRKGRQGGAVYGDYLFQFLTELGNIHVYDLRNSANVDTITLTANPNNHAGSGGFSNVFYDNADNFPLLYISSMEEKCIYVYRISGNVGSLSATLIQTIKLSTIYYLPNIAVDVANNKIVVFAYTDNSYNYTPINKSVIMSFDIPDYAEDVTIGEFENIFILPFIYAEQGACAKNGNLYLSYGNTNYPDKQGGGIIIIDYINKQIKNLIGLRAIGLLEPEALCLWDGNLVLTTQAREVYKLSF